MGNVTKAGITIEYQNEQYEVSPLGLRELEYLETYVQGRVIAAGRESLHDEMSPKDRDEAMQSVIDYASRVNVMSEEGFERLINPAGIVRLVYVSLRRKSPELTLEKCREIMRDTETAKQIREAINQLNPKPRTSSKNLQAPLEEGASTTVSQ